MPIEPDDKLLSDLIKRKLEEYKTKIQQTIQPRTVGDPVLERAINRIRLSHLFDPELQNANIQPMNWNENLATSNIMGITTPQNQITVNPTMLSLFPEYNTDETLAHELTHVRQNLGSLADLLKYENLLPYKNRPKEIQAESVAKEFRNRIPLKELLKQENLPFLKGNVVPPPFKKEYF